MDSALVSTALDNTKKFWKSDESENDEIDLLLDNIPELSSTFDVKKRIGHGAFSAVYLAYGKRASQQPNPQMCAIKHIIPTSHPSRIYMELKCLKMMGGKDNIIEVLSCLRHLNHVVMIMPYFPSDPFAEYVGKLSINELRSYLINLFLALKRVHQFNIIHRDVKPSNFLYSRKHRKYTLIDFGLAQEVQPSQEMNASNKHPVPPSLTETPLLNPSRVVKRKLSIMSKSPEYVSSRGASSGTLFSNTSSTASPQWNSPVFLRRSPRKLPTALPRSPQKENLCCSISLPTDLSRTPIHIHDSPSKHTRLAEALKFTDDCSDYGKVENNFLGFGNERSIEIKNRGGIKRKREALLQKNVSILAAYPKLKKRAATHKYNTIKSSSLQQVKTKSGQSVLCPSLCNCYGSSRLCAVCLARKNQHANRAGTPGFRAPEVLMKHPHQTTAVDMWSAGIILLCLLSGRYPFFQSVDDLSSLAEITTIFGSQALKKAATKLEKLYTSSETKPALDLKKICEKLRTYIGLPKAHHTPRPECTGCRQSSDECVCKLSPTSMEQPLDLSKTAEYKKSNSESPFHLPNNCISPLRCNKYPYPDAVYDLLSHLLDLNPLTRISASEALEHPFLAGQTALGT